MKKYYIHHTYFGNYLCECKGDFMENFMTVLYLGLFDTKKQKYFKDECCNGISRFAHKKDCRHVKLTPEMKHTIFRLSL